jgi:hypothetical protein
MPFLFRVVKEVSKLKNSVLPLAKFLLQSVMTCQWLWKHVLALHHGKRKLITPLVTYFDTCATVSVV